MWDLKPTIQNLLKKQKNNKDLKIYIGSGRKLSTEHKLLSNYRSIVIVIVFGIVFICIVFMDELFVVL